MNEEQAVVVRLAALRQHAAVSLDAARVRLPTDPGAALDHLTEASAALGRALEIEREAA